MRLKPAASLGLGIASLATLLVELVPLATAFHLAVVPRRSQHSRSPSAATAVTSLSVTSDVYDDDDATSAAASGPSRMSRRAALQTVAGLISTFPFLLTAAVADGETDLTSTLFNPDGSLKEGAGIEQEAKSRTVVTSFPGGAGDATPGKKALVSVDGSNPTTAAAATSAVKVSYELPEKWGSPETGYLDRSEGINAKSADSITTFQLAAPAEVKTLDKASTLGVAKALGIETLPEFNKSILKADLISGRRSTRDGVVYYEFDLAVAPASCASGTKEDLGLGFCPYDSIVLFGAAVVDGRMYGIMVDCDREEWKKGNADLKRVRSSFKVDSELELMKK